MSAASVVVNIRDLPSAQSFDNPRSEFLQRNTLPSINDVLRADAAARRGGSQDFVLLRRDVILFRHLNLVVKYKRDENVSLLAEAQTMWAIKHYLSDVPVPEVYGWRHDERGNVFIYMQYIEGPTLEQRWGSLDREEKSAIVETLRYYVNSLGRLKQGGEANKRFIGTVFFFFAAFVIMEGL